MRIALVHMRHAPIGGTELVLDGLARKLAEQGHDVTIVCRSHGDAPHERVRFEVLRSPAIGSAWRMWAFATAVERHVASRRYDLVVGLGKTWTHDVVRTGGGSHATFIERMQRAGVTSLRDRAVFRALKDHAALEIERRAYAPGAYRRVIANSRMVQRDIARRYDVPLDAFDVVHNGVDLERFHPRERAQGDALRRSLGIAPEKIVFLFLGKGFARKGLDRALEALALSAARAPNALLLVVGRDSSQATYERLADRLRLNERVRFLGERKDPEVCFAASDVHVLPTHYDSFAFTVLEAMASGVPVITTDGAGASELLDDGVHGAVLSRDCTPDDLAAAMVAWSDRERARAAGAMARQRAEAHGFDAMLERTASAIFTAIRPAKAATS
jgi:UDP-glucose:(heptosyl)LPS alpha-1,3-glucosyltransferase